MIGIDTNVLIRYLVQDDEQQAIVAENLLKKYQGQKQSIFINNIVICEIVWVLERGYKYNNNQISLAIRNILSIEEFFFENANILWIAFKEYENSKAEYSDILIAKLNKYVYKCNTTFTFDKSAVKTKDFAIAK